MSKFWLISVGKWCGNFWDVFLKGKCILFFLLSCFLRCLREDWDFILNSKGRASSFRAGDTES